ncbi:MAG: glycine cleavage system protein GcvH [Nitrospinota bacterium]
MSFPDGLKYTKEHEWVLVETDTVRVGVTEYAQEQLGDVVFVELPEIGSEVCVGESFGVVESVKTVSDVYSPVSGEVFECNGVLEGSPELINSDPYGDGWIVKIKYSDPKEFDELLTQEEYAAFVEEESV